MAKKRDRSSKSATSKSKPSPLKEVLAQLDAMKSDPSASGIRLRADIARDTVEELSDHLKQMREQIRRQNHQIRKLQERSQKWRTRLTELLHELSTGPVILPGVQGHDPVDHDQLLLRYRQLKEQDFHGLAQALHAAAGTKDVPAYQLFLVDEILIKGSRIVAEHLVRHAGVSHADGDEDDFMDRLRHHVAGNVCQGLARLVQYQVTPEVGKHLDTLIVNVMRFLSDLLTATPPGRLLLPQPECPFDPEQHEPTHGRPAKGELKVLATLFPGYVVLEDTPRVVEKAEVYTDRV